LFFSFFFALQHTPGKGSGDGGLAYPGTFVFPLFASIFQKILSKRFIDYYLALTWRISERTTLFHGLHRAIAAIAV